MREQSFKAGDRVRVNSDVASSWAGAAGVVTDPDDGGKIWPVWVCLDDAGGAENCFDADELELILEPQPPQLGPMARAIERHLMSVGSISGVEAAALYRCRDLPKRISELKQVGISIRAEFKHDRTGQRYARYTLVA